MTVEEIRTLDNDAIEVRMAEIKSEMNAENADYGALNAEVDAIEERRAELKNEAEERAAAVAEVISAPEVKPIIEERKTMTDREIRNSEEYINAYANFIKTGKDAECRALLTDVFNQGTVPVPTYVEDKIRTAWEKDGIMQRVKKTFFKGILKVGVELWGDDAAPHEEGAAAPTEEELSLYIAELLPMTVKKWIKVSDEVVDYGMGGGRAFLDYIYDEIEYKIVKCVADTAVQAINALAVADDRPAPVPQRGNVTTSGINDIVNAFALLSDSAENPVVIMSKASYAYYVGLANSANYAIDPFCGMDVIFNDTLPAVNASGTAPAVIVGDLSAVQCNFPNGYEVQFKYDDLSLAEADLVKIVGRMPVGIGVVAHKHFATVSQAA